MAEQPEAKPDESGGSVPDVPTNGEAGENAPQPSEPVKALRENDLPVVEAPRLDAGDMEMPPAVEAFTEPTSEAAGEVARAPVSEPAAPTRTSRFALLAAALAIAAALGSFVGPLSASGLGHMWPGGATYIAADANMLQAVKATIAEFSMIRASIDGATRNANSQFAKLAERLDRVERAQADPAKIGRIADAVDQLGKRALAPPEITGSIAAGQPPATEVKTTDRILEGWIVADVQGGNALVESHYGGMFDAAPGSTIPGLGRVESIKRQDGKWVVVTAHGTIMSAR